MKARAGIAVLSVIPIILAVLFINGFSSAGYETATGPSSHVHTSESSFAVMAYTDSSNTVQVPVAHYHFVTTSAGFHVALGR
jgi:hypothetical protein